MPDTKQEKEIAPTGTILRAANGDILRYDPTGIQIVLSDRVISDIARRLPATGPATDGSATPVTVGAPAGPDPEVLGDIDAWNLRRDGEWLLFTARLPGAQGTRQFRRLVQPDSDDALPHIIADAPGALRGILSLGGPRRCTSIPQTPDFPWHVLAPADEIGAVGMGGTEAAEPQSLLQPLPELTRDAALADVLLGQYHAAHRALPLHLIRAETDSSASVAELAQGTAYGNLMTAAASLQAAARRLGKAAVLYSVGVEFALEDLQSNGKAYRDGFYDLLARLTRDLGGMGFRRPPYLAVFDCGTHEICDHPVLRAQWELAWQGPAHGFCYTAPGYMFRQDRFARPDADALWQMAEMEAEALAALHAGQEWSCPVFLLAEREATEPHVIRVRARALVDLTIDQTDPFGAGAACGFSLEGVTNGAKITGVACAPDDNQDILLTCDKPPEGKGLTVLYAFGVKAKRKAPDFPSACGAIRDTWSATSRTGTTLHRWALPAALPVH